MRASSLSRRGSCATQSSSSSTVPGKASEPLRIASRARLLSLRSAQTRPRRQGAADEQRQARVLLPPARPAAARRTDGARPAPRRSRMRRRKRAICAKASLSVTRCSDHTLDTSARHHGGARRARAPELVGLRRGVVFKSAARALTRSCARPGRRGLSSLPRASQRSAISAGKDADDRKDGARENEAPSGPHTGAVVAAPRVLNVFAPSILDGPPDDESGWLDPRTNALPLSSILLL